MEKKNVLTTLKCDLNKTKKIDFRFSVKMLKLNLKKIR